MHHIWRSAHFALAAISAIFILLATVSGIVLSFEPIHETLGKPGFQDLADVRLTDFVGVLQANYEEVLEVQVEDGQFVKVSALSMDESLEGDFYVDPQTAEHLVNAYQTPRIFEWTTSFHRSLFLKTPGRIFVGITAFLMLLITLTGLGLLIKRLGWRGFFFRFEKMDFYTYYHTYLGRLYLIPIFIIAGTGLILSLARFELLPGSSSAEATISIPATTSVFETTTLADVTRIEFPFSADEEDYFYIYKKDAELAVNQFTGAVVEEKVYPFSMVAQAVSFDLHTGSGSIWWSLVLLTASLSILFFMYSGFVISYRRLAGRLRNRVSAEEAELVLLMGSENGKTRLFANLVVQALTAAGQKIFVDDLNNYQSYPSMRQLLVLTSTYGDGEPPANARKFLQKLKSVQLEQTVSYAVAGFGSTKYPKFCQFAKDVEAALAAHACFTQLQAPVYINKNEYPVFKAWVSNWAAQQQMVLELPEKLLIPKAKKYDFEVVAIKHLNDLYSETFTLELASPKSGKFIAGDLISIQAPGTNEPRLYSVGKRDNGNLLLVIKRHEFGKCSNYLAALQVGDTFVAEHTINTHFHFPSKASKVILVANGTGIAPFVGMVPDSSTGTEVELLWGTRTSASYEFIQSELIRQEEQRKLLYFGTAISKEDHPHRYVQDIIKGREQAYATSLDDGAIVMICGSTTMQSGVLKTLDAITQKYNGKPIEWYQSNHQILSDCY